MTQDGAPLTKYVEDDIMAVVAKYSGQGLTVAELLGILEGVKFSVLYNHTIHIIAQQKGDRDDT